MKRKYDDGTNGFGAVQHRTPKQAQTHAAMASKRLKKLERVHRKILTAIAESFEGSIPETNDETLELHQLTKPQELDLEKVLYRLYALEGTIRCVIGHHDYDAVLECIADQIGATSELVGRLRNYVLTGDGYEEEWDAG